MGQGIGSNVRHGGFKVAAVCLKLECAELRERVCGGWHRVTLSARRLAGPRAARFEVARDTRSVVTLSATG